jgi:ATP-binding cassette subfamily B (MDR/TAP) protein 1
MPQADSHPLLQIGWFDKIGSGEITGKIETDSHLIQEAISDKVPMSAFFLGSFFAGFIIAIIRNWRLALVISTIIPCIGLAGAFMNKFVTDAKTRQLAATGRGATLAEEVISSVRSAHAFGTQRKLAELYNEPNEETNQVGQASAKYQGFGLGVFFFIIYASYALAFYYGTTLILRKSSLTPLFT